MNEEAESFKQRLKRQPLRPLPAEWRGEILKAVRDAQAVSSPTGVSKNSFLSDLNRRLSSLLWPHPIAWGGLAAVWVFIFAVNFSIQDKPAGMAEKVLPPSPEVIGESPQQQHLYAQLMGFQLTGSDDSSYPDRQKAFAPRPRSERINFETKAIL